MLLKFGIISVVIFMLLNDHTCLGQFDYSGYENVPGVGAHKFHPEGRTWNEARKACIREGGSLAILDNVAVDQHLRGILLANSWKINGADRPDLAWLGVHSQFPDRDWVTVLGEPLQDSQYEPWHKSHYCWGVQPDNKGGNQRCAALIRDCGQMDDVECSAKLPFFCEKTQYESVKQ